VPNFALGYELQRWRSAAILTIPSSISDHATGSAQVYLSELLGHRDSA